jgi:hypothetical protein
MSNGHLAHVNGNGNGKNDHIRRADVNRARKIQAVREFTRLLEEATAPDFTGNVKVEVPAKTGNLGPVKVTRENWPEE